VAALHAGMHEHQRSDERVLPGRGGGHGTTLQAAVRATGPGGTASAVSNQSAQVLPNAGDIKAALGHVVMPSGKKARIDALLEAGSYTFRLTPPSAGKLTIIWSDTVRVGHKNKTTTVAKVTITFTSTKTADVR
jgi:hypothetical protein